MSYTIGWADDSHTMVRQVYEGHVGKRAFEAMVHESVRLLETVTHNVDVAIEWHGEQTLMHDLSVIYGAMFAERYVPTNQRFVFVIKAPAVYRIFANTMRRAAPRAIGALYFVDTLEDAFRLRDFLLEAGVSSV